MTRNEFLKICNILGISLPFLPALTSCKDKLAEPTGFSGKVLIVGAGAAGLTCGYLLAQQGIEFQVLEASGTFGGRMKRTEAFADFPIPLGAEWLHVDDSEFDAIVNNPDVEIGLKMIGYDREAIVGTFAGGELQLRKLGNFADQKFIRSTWFDFFAEYIAPDVLPKTTFRTQVSAVDYQGDRVLVVDQNDLRYEADKVVITVPLKILQDGDIRFDPLLPPRMQESIAEAVVWGGIKVFLEFSERFYPTFLEFSDSETQDGQRIYYDAAYGQDTTTNILGLFAVGKQAESYQAHDGDQLRDYILTELDEVFAGKASQSYLKHLVQNWNEEPFARAAYLADVVPSRISRRLAQSVDGKVYFAGEAYTRENDWGAVHNAARSARDVVQEIL